MQNKKFSFSVALSTSLTTNLLNPPTATGGTNGGSSAQYILLQHLRVTNKHASTTAKVSLWRGATGANAAGTECAWQNTPIAPGGYLDVFFAGGKRFDSADFLVGGSDTATALVLEGEGEIGVAG